MSSYQVSVEEIQNACGGVRSSTASIQAEVQKLTNQLNGLQTTWKGTAAASFQNVVTQWNGAQKNVEQALESINQALNAAGQTYENAENAASKMFAN